MELPIDSAKQKIFSALDQSTNLLLVAQTGAGKTTRLPTFLDEYFGSERTRGAPIVVLEPRRILAIEAANRIARESKTQLVGTDASRLELGRDVGYAVRGGSQMTAQTRIRFMTEGLFLNQLTGGQWSRKFPSALVFDEFHERSLEADLILGLVRERQILGEIDTRIVAMSATLETERLKRYLADPRGSASVVEVDGRLFPVEVSYSDKPLSLKLDQQWVGTVIDRIARAARSLPNDASSILVFLPGRREIRAVRKALENGLWNSQNRFDSQWQVQELHGGLSLADQSAIVEPADSGLSPRIILSTNIAESSLTIQGVGAVIDTGVERRAVLLPSGLEALKVFRISKSSADQRKGRAGRTGPGRCYRLWSETDHRSAPDHLESELQSRSPLETVYLLASAGYPSPLQFEWYEPPKSPQALAQALGELVQLGVLSQSHELTHMGQVMRDSGLSFKAALFWAQFGASKSEPSSFIQTIENEMAAWAASILSEPDFVRSTDGSTLTELLEWVRSGHQLNHADSRLLDWIVRSARRLLEGQDDKRKTKEVHTLTEPVLSALAESHWRQLCRLRKEDDEKRAVLAGGGEVYLPNRVVEQHSNSEYFIVFRAMTTRDSSTSDRIVATLLEPVSRSSIELAFQNQIQLEIQTNWSDLDQGVYSVKFKKLGVLPLSEPQRVETDATQALPLLSEQLFQLVQNQRCSPSVSQLLTRLEFFQSLRSKNPDGVSQADKISAAIRSACMKAAQDLVRQKRYHLRDIAQNSHFEQDLLNEFLLSDWEQFKDFDRAVPKTVTLENGRTTPVLYYPSQRPKISVRLQLLLGVRETPSIGLPPYLFQPDCEILGPHGRPIQITRDLAAFWRGSYFDIRKELRGRYPKQAWPEDPLDPVSVARALKSKVPK